MWYCVVLCSITLCVWYCAVLHCCNGSDGLREVSVMEFLGVFLHVTKSKYGIVCTLYVLILCHNGSDCVVWYCVVMEAMV